MATGEWRMRQIYDSAYFPIAGTMWVLGLLGLLPRVKASTKNEGHERRYFYGSVWAVCVAQPVLWFLWSALPRGRSWDALKLAVFVGILAYVGTLARRGRLPRTRPIVRGSWRSRTEATPVLGLGLALVLVARWSNTPRLK